MQAPDVELTHEQAALPQRMPLPRAGASAAVDPAYSTTQSTPSVSASVPTSAEAGALNKQLFNGTAHDRHVASSNTPTSLKIDHPRDPISRISRPVATGDDVLSKQPHQDAGTAHAATDAADAAQQISRNSGREFLRGMAASAVNIIATFPLNKLISRQAYEGLSIREAFHTMRVDGATQIYRGVFPPLLQKGVSMGVVYGAFDWYFHLLTYLVTGKVEERAATDVPTGESSWAIRGTAAVLSGSTEAVFTPFERMQTILQHRHYTHHFSNTLDVFNKLRPYGVGEFYRGGSAILLRNGPSNAIFFLLREPVRNLIPPLGPSPATTSTSSTAGAGRPATTSESGSGWNVLRDFFSGAVLGATLSTVFYPINTAKSVMQLSIGGRHRGIWETLKQIYHERQGLTGLYRGVGGNAARALLSWGIVNSAYEVAKGLDKRQSKLA